MERTRFKGHLPSEGSTLRAVFDAQGEPAPRAQPIGALIQRLGGNAAPVPTTVSLLPFIGAVNDQSITNSCVAQAGTKALYVRGRKMGLVIPELSAQASYAMTRGASLMPGMKLLDVGSIPLDFWITASTFGVVSAERVPLDPGTINDRVPLDVFVAGADAHVTAYHAIETQSDARCTEIRSTLSAGVPVVFAMPVDKAYEDLADASVYQGPTGPNLGGHDQLIIGFGPGFFQVLGSWGTAFAADGVARISDSFIGSDDCSEFFAADLAPGGAH